MENEGRGKTFLLKSNFIRCNNNVKNKPLLRGENELSIGQVESHAPVVSLLWMSRVNLLACHSNGILRLWILDTKKYTLSLTKVGLAVMNELFNFLNSITLLYSIHWVWKSLRCLGKYHVIIDVFSIVMFVSYFLRNVYFELTYFYTYLKK